jgi:hypothetical protein
MSDFCAGRAQEIDAGGGPAQTLAANPCSPCQLYGGTWSRNGVILFSVAPAGTGATIYRVPDAGGAPSSLTKLDASQQETAQLWPNFLP